MKTYLLVAVLAFAVSAAAQEQGKDNVDGVLERFDKNGNGVLETAEMPPQLAKRVDQFDKDGDGKLDRKELAPVADRMNRGGGSRGSRGAGGGREGEKNMPPAKGERSEDKLKVGDKAPGFTLPRADGKGEITLSEYQDGKPTVLVFGNLTCPPFRSRMLQFDPIHLKHAGKANFLMVYTREAHPESTIYVMKEGKEVLETIEQTDKMEERMEHAQMCGPTLKFTFPTVVDKEDNKVNKAYAGWPSRFVVVGADGRVAYDGGPGPGGFQPAELEKWLEANAK